MGNDLSSPTSGDSFRHHYHDHSLENQGGKQEKSPNPKSESESLDDTSLFTATQEAFNRYVKVDAENEERLTEAIRADKRNKAYWEAKKKAYLKNKNRPKEPLKDKNVQISINRIHPQA